jgi:general secretion pathway protein H
MPRHAAQRGFSLLEIMLVLTLVGLMFGLVAVSIGRGVSNAEIRNANREVAAALRYTRSLAMRRHAEQVFLVDVENRSWQVPGRPAVTIPDDMDITIDTARSEVTGEQTAGIRFFGDGSSTGGRVRLSTGGREWVVGVEWLTGEITRGELQEG